MSASEHTFGSAKGDIVVTARAALETHGAVAVRAIRKVTQRCKGWAWAGLRDNISSIMQSSHCDTAEGVHISHYGGGRNELQ